MIIGLLEKMFLAGKITEEEYRKKKVEYVDMLYELYVKDYITLEELKEKLNE